MKKIMLLLITILLLTGCKDQKLEKIKKAKVSECDEYTINELIDNNLLDYEWEKDDKEYFVKGTIFLDNDYRDIKIKIDNEDKIEINKIKLNNESVTSEQKKSIINLMCKKTQYKKEDKTKTMKDISVRILYNDTKYNVEGIPSTVDITFYGKEEDLKNLKENQGLSAYADLFNIDAGKNQKVYLKLDYRSDIIYEIKPSYVNANIYEVQSTKKELTPELINNTKNYTANLSYKEIVVKADEETLNKVDKVKAIIDASTTDYSTDKIVAYDKDGNKINDVSFIPEIIYYSLKKE